MLLATITSTSPVQEDSSSSSGGLSISIMTHLFYHLLQEIAKSQWVGAYELEEKLNLNYGSDLGLLEK